MAFNYTNHSVIRRKIELPNVNFIQLRVRSCRLRITEFILYLFILSYTRRTNYPYNDY